MTSILIIDDDIWFADRLARVMEKAGYNTTQARNGLEGMTAIDASIPDVIVLDFFMPGPNGMVLLHELQSYTDLAAIPVVICTNVAHELKLRELQPYGVRHILDKTTMGPDGIIAAIRKVMA